MLFVRYQVQVSLVTMFWKKYSNINLYDTVTEIYNFNVIGYLASPFHSNSHGSIEFLF